MGRMRDKSTGRFIKNKKFRMVMKTLSSKIYETPVLITRLHAKIV
jgi:hypothetical protein